MNAFYLQHYASFHHFLNPIQKHQQFFSKTIEPLCLMKYEHILQNMKNNKQVLLAPNQINQEWIMLQDIPSNNPKQLPQNNHGYAKLQDNTLKNQQIRDIENKRMKKIQEIPTEQPFNPKLITINGDTFKQVESPEDRERERLKAAKKPKNSKVPEMQVSCYLCVCVQTVPATSERFTCGRCASENKCVPLYRIFVCGTCQAKVCYATGTSQLIKCTKCNTINRVPLSYGNPYEANYRVGNSLDREERETDPFREECLEMSEGGFQEDPREDFNGYFREK